MSAQLLSSKVTTQEEPSGARAIQGVATAVLAFPGVSQKGPVGVSTLLTSFEQFVKIFGGDIAGSYSASIARGFFNGGGQRLYFTRVVHYSNITIAASKTSAAGTLSLLSAASIPTAARVTGSIVGPFALASGDTIRIDRDAAGQATATFTAVAAQIMGSEVEPFALADGQTLKVIIDDGSEQTITFDDADFLDITEATRAEVLSAITAHLTGATAIAAPDNGILIRSATKGTDSAVQIVSGGTAAAALGLAVSTAAGTGNVPDIGVVTIADIKAVVEAAISGVTVSNVGGAVRITAVTAGPSGLIQVIASSTADDELGLDNNVHNGSNGTPQPSLKINAKYDGTYSNKITILITPATSGIASDFNLSVLFDGYEVEPFPNLSMLDSAQRYAVSIINSVDGSGSNYIQVEDLHVSDSPSGAAAERPASSSGSPLVAYGPLTGGADGLVGITDVDFVGDPASRLGFNSFDLNDDIELLICPERATPGAHNAGLSYASVTRKGNVFFIADPPAGLTPAGVNTYVTQTAAIKNTTEHGAFYWPRIKVLNPNTALYGTDPTITIPPSGHIAAMFARTDSARVGGIYDPPGGVERGQLAGVIGLENDEVLDERVRDLIAPNLINPITRLRGQPIAVDDVQTLLSSGDFPTIAERRGVTFIERSVEDGTQFVRIRNIDETLCRQAKGIVDAFLLTQMRVGAFRSKNPSTAFYVDTSPAINPPSEQFAGRFHLRMGLATQKPARFVIISVSQDTRALDEELAAAG